MFFSTYSLEKESCLSRFFVAGTSGLPACTKVLEAMACMAMAMGCMAMGCMVRIQMSTEHPLNLKNLYNMEDAWYIYYHAMRRSL